MGSCKMGEVGVHGRAEIDTRPPFTSVKEAVSLFGERLFSGQIHCTADEANKMDPQEHNISKQDDELEETKLRLQKARQETTVMAHCLSSLQEELERTKTQLQELKLERESEKQMIMMMEFETDQDDEHLKFVQHHSPHSNNRMMRNLPQTSPDVANGAQDVYHHYQHHSKRYVTFANAPPISLQRHPSLRKKKQHPLIPLKLIAGIFSGMKKNKKGSEVASAVTP